MESPHWELFEFTKLLNSKQAELIPEGYTNRCIYATIINRCYYSSFNYASEWLKKKYEFIPLKNMNMIILMIIKVPINKFGMN